MPPRSLRIDELFRPVGRNVQGVKRTYGLERYSTNRSWVHRNPRKRINTAVSSERVEDPPPHASPRSTSRRFAATPLADFHWIYTGTGGVASPASSASAFSDQNLQPTEHRGSPFVHHPTQPAVDKEHVQGRRQFSVIGRAKMSDVVRRKRAYVDKVGPDSGSGRKIST